jgi:hypothetical protein
MRLTLADLTARTKPMAEKKKKHFIKQAIKHPGREIERAKRNGVSVHEQMEKDAHSKNPSLRGAGQLGLRLSSMSHKRKHKSKLYDHPRSSGND